SAVRRALEPKDNQKSDEAKAVEQLRNALLPSTNTARAAVLQRTNSDSEFEQQLSDLTSLIQTHPGLEHNRAALHSFGMMLNRVSTLSERTPTSPLLTAIMAGLNLPTAGNSSNGAASASAVSQTDGNSGNQDGNTGIGAELSGNPTSLSGSEPANGGSGVGNSS
ncbi:TPA: hypothetical protein ACPE6X_004165, partial [Providencia rettgeri]